MKKKTRGWGNGCGTYTGTVSGAVKETVKKINVTKREWQGKI
jgi:hypothetical protein